MFLEILDSKRRKLLPQLAFLKKHGFYMAGGTALALQIGHRTSLEIAECFAFISRLASLTRGLAFDFYTQKKFLIKEVKNYQEKCLK